MSTILFNQIVFGPIRSRRLGISLGINLLPSHGKFCNFDCLYCECGFNKDFSQDKTLPKYQDIIDAITHKLKNHDQLIGRIDTITFSGNGEPTLHPDFHIIIDKTLELRDLYAKEAKVSVLTNGSMINRETVKNALLKIDNPIIKIDSGKENVINLLDRPQFNYSLEKMIENLKPFEGKYILQTMFLKGKFNGIEIDSAISEDVNLWYEIVYKTKPREIMIYTIDRETPAKELLKVTIPELEKIAFPLKERGYKVSISG
jgi:wyosine [tRNA(Phe)-imidazoG37] synthetase (radical SAM superfamily)